MKKPVKSPLDFMIAQAQLDSDIAEEIVGSIRLRQNSSATPDQNGYYEEKMAAKMLDFFKQEEKVITLYVEAKTSYPIMAELMENKRPYLKQLLEESRKLYERSLIEK